MTRPKLNLSRVQLLSYALFTLSAVILLMSFLLTMNVTVLKDWKLSVPAAEIHAGDTVTLVSAYTKVRDVTGKSVRYIECQNANSVYIRYPLNEAVANRQKGSGGTGVVVKVPESIPNLPTICKFTIAITYDVYPWRKVNVSNSTNEFQLLPKRDVPQEVTLSEPSSAQTNQGLALAPVSSQTDSISSTSSPNNTPTSPSAQPNNSQNAAMPDGTPTSAERTLAPTPQTSDDRSALGRLPIVGGLLNAIGL